MSISEDKKNEGAIFEIESEGIMDLVRKVEPEPELEDQVEPDGENENGNIQDDTHTIYYNQTKRSFVKSEHSIKRQNKDVQHVPDIEEVDERKSEEVTNKDPSKVAFSRQQYESVSNTDVIEESKSEQSLPEPVNEPDSNQGDDKYSNKEEYKIRAKTDKRGDNIGRPLHHETVNDFYLYLTL